MWQYFLRWKNWKFKHDQWKLKFACDDCFELVKAYKNYHSRFAQSQREFKRFVQFQRRFKRFKKIWKMNSFNWTLKIVFLNNESRFETKIVLCIAR